MEKLSLNYSQAMDYFEDWKKFVHSDKDLSFEFALTNFIRNKKAWKAIEKRQKRVEAFAIRFFNELSESKSELVELCPSQKDYLEDCFQDFIKKIHKIDLSLDPTYKHNTTPPPDGNEPKQRGPKSYPHKMIKHLLLLESLANLVTGEDKKKFKMELFEYLKPEGEFDLWIKKKLKFGTRGRKFRSNKKIDILVQIKWVEDFFRDQRKLLAIKNLRPRTRKTKKDSDAYGS